MTLGERILQKRKECGLSQEGLGEKLDVTRQTVYKWESDQAVPELDKLITLAQIFGVGVGWLIAEEENDQKEQAYLEAAQRIAAHLAQSQAPQPAGSEPETEAAKAPAGEKINWFQALVAAALVIILAAGTFKFASIDREIASLEKKSQSSFSASSQNEEPVVFSAGPSQETQSFTTEAELAVYRAPTSSARLVGTLAPGDTIEVLRTDTVGVHLWGFIRHQLSDGTELPGWIILDDMEKNMTSGVFAVGATEPSQGPQSFTTETDAAD